VAVDSLWSTVRVGVGPGEWSGYQSLAFACCSYVPGDRSAGSRCEIIAALWHVARNRSDRVALCRILLRNRPMDIERPWTCTGESPPGRIILDNAVCRAK